MSQRSRANVLLLVTAAIWGLAFVGQRVGAETMDAFSFNAVRFALGGLSLIPLIKVMDARSSASGSWRDTLVPGLLCGGWLFAGSTLQQLGLESTTAGNAGFITGLYMVLVPIFGLALGQRTTRWVWWGIALAVAGLYLLSAGDSFSLGGGDALVLVGAGFWAGHILALEHYSRRTDPLRLACLQILVCAVASAGVALFQERPFGGLTPAIWAVLYGGLMSVGIAYTLQVFGQRHAKASTAALLLSLEAVFALLGGILILGEPLTARTGLGCALMLAGILVAQRGAPPHPVEPGLGVTG